MLANIRGLKPLTNKTKVQQISDLCSLHNAKVICLTETHGNSNIKDAEIHISGYHMIRCDRENRSHGGTIIYVSNDYQYKNLLCYSNGQCETVVISIKSHWSVLSVGAITSNHTI